MKINKKFATHLLIACGIFIPPALLSGQPIVEAIIPPCLGTLLGHALLE
jgi:hypothetical protein